jgi:Zn-dependent protease with chaperone function
MVAAMAVPYLARLICLVFAAMFLVHAAAAAAVAAVSRTVIARAASLRPGAGATLLLALRLFPAGAAFLFGCICLVSYVLYEPEAALERIGWPCVAAAGLGATFAVAGLARGFTAVIRSATFLRRCREQDAPVFVLAGIVRRRVTVTPSMRRSLTTAEFDAALRHEEAHGRSWDNLKRLAILASPPIFPFGCRFRLLESRWRQLTEFAADDEAVAGSPDRALALASALVRAGRVSSRIPAMTLAAPLVADSEELADRVQRLLDCPASPPATHPRVGWLFALAAVACGASLPMLPTVHEFLEALAH